MRSMQSVSSLNSEQLRTSNLKSTITPNQHKRLQDIDEIHPEVLRQRLDHSEEELISESSEPKKQKDQSDDRDLRVGKVVFSPKEREIIQMVFFTIDRFDNGKVGYTDVQEWALEEGFVMSKEDAKLCVAAIDYNGDMKIGISDFFMYASKLKEDWERSDRQRTNGYFSDSDDADSRYFEEEENE